MKIGTCPSLVDPRAGDQRIIAYVILVGNRQRSLRCGKRPFCRTDAGLQAAVHKSDAAYFRFPPQLQLLIERWPTLSKEVQQQIMRLVG